MTRLHQLRDGSPVSTQSHPDSVDPSASSAVPLDRTALWRALLSRNPPAPFEDPLSVFRIPHAPSPTGGASTEQVEEPNLRGSRNRRHAFIRSHQSHHGHLMRVGCVLGTCQVQNLGHRLYQLVGQAGREDSSPKNLRSPHSYGWALDWPWPEPQTPTKTALFTHSHFFSFFWLIVIKLETAHFSHFVPWAFLEHINIYTEPFSGQEGSYVTDLVRIQNTRNFTLAFDCYLFFFGPWSLHFFFDIVIPLIWGLTFLPWSSAQKWCVGLWCLVCDAKLPTGHPQTGGSLT